MDKMNQSNRNKSRRKFIKQSSMLPLGGLGFMHLKSPVDNTIAVNDLMIGPIKGYTPHIGTMVTMLNYMRETIVSRLTNLSIKELDFLLDDEANSIGAILLHMVAIDTSYQRDSFDGKAWSFDNEKDNKALAAAMDLGDAGRKLIKGYPIEFYLNALKESRAFTLEQLKEKDDEWLLKKDLSWGRRNPVNNYWKWFHVCEHESNHNGQIRIIRKRIT